MEDEEVAESWEEAADSGVRAAARRARGAGRGARAGGAALPEEAAGRVRRRGGPAALLGLLKGPRPRSARGCAGRPLPRCSPVLQSPFMSFLGAAPCASSAAPPTPRVLLVVQPLLGPAGLWLGRQRGLSEVAAQLHTKLRLPG